MKDLGAALVCLYLLVPTGRVHPWLRRIDGYGRLQPKYPRPYQCAWRQEDAAVATFGIGHHYLHIVYFTVFIIPLASADYCEYISK